MKHQQVAVVTPTAARSEVPLDKQQQKAVKSRVLDHVGPYLRLVQLRLSSPSFRAALPHPHVQPVYASGQELLLPAGYPQAPASSIETKFVTSSYFRHRAAINHLVYTSDGRRLLCAGNNGNVSLWNGTNFENELGPGIQAHEASPIRCLSFSHSGLYLLSCDDSGRVKFSKPTLEVLQVYHAHKEPCRSVTFSPTDFKFATGSDDSTVRVFDTFRGQELSMTGHGGDVRCVDWHPHKGLIASCSKDGCVKLWDPRAGSCTATLHGHKNGVFQAKWNLNGCWLLSCSRDQLLKLYDVRMLREAATFRGHGRDVTCCAWHPLHEEVFVSGGADGSLMMWLASRQDAQGVLPTAHEATVWSVAWHPLGHVLASAGGDQKCQFWCRKRAGDIWQDVFGRDPAEVAAANFAGTGTAAPGLFGDGVAPAAAAAMAASAGMLGPSNPGGRAAAAAAPQRAGAGGPAGPSARPKIIPGIGMVLDQLATANLQGLMAGMASASAGGGGSATTGAAMATAAGAPGAPAAATVAGAKRSRDDDSGGLPFRERERDRGAERGREGEGEPSKHPRLRVPGVHGEGPGGYGNERARGPGRDYDPRRGEPGPPFPPGPGMDRQPFDDWQPEAGRRDGFGGRPPGVGPSREDALTGRAGEPMPGPPGPHLRRHPPQQRFPGPHDGPPESGPRMGQVSERFGGSRGGGAPPPYQGAGPGPNQGRPFGGGSHPYGDAGGYRGGGGVDGGEGADPGGRGGERHGPGGREFPGGHPSGQDGPFGPGPGRLRGPHHGPPPHLGGGHHRPGGPPPHFGEGPGPRGPEPGPGFRGRGRGPPPPGWPGRGHR